MNDSTNYGWVRLHRKFLKSDMWLSKPFTKGQAWIDLFANANHKEGTFWIRGTPIKVGRGQIAWSKLTMSDRWGWSEGKVDRFISYLQTEEQIGVQTSSKTTLITILNYELYQADSGTNKGTNGERTENRQGTNKNDKKEKNTGVAIAPQDFEIVPEPLEGKKRTTAKYPNAKTVFSWFPNPELSWTNNTTELTHAELLYKRGEAKVKSALKYALDRQGHEFFYKITKPSDLERKWVDLVNHHD